ncbi:hypothetical protein FRC15_002170 [Serendipita sp. 397]|nr:hypothetical protein FRC15_002170 [Serendipita sp. 397]
MLFATNISLLSPVKREASCFSTFIPPQPIFVLFHWPGVCSIYYFPLKSTVLSNQDLPIPHRRNYLQID